MRRRYSAFTLLEVLISLGILSLLIVVLMRAYTTVSLLTFRAQQQDNEITQLLSLSQIVQTLAEQSTLDYSRYDSWTLVLQKGIVDRLYLSWFQWSQELFTSSGALYLHNSSGQFLLTDSHSSLFSGMVFKIIPWENPLSLLQEQSVDDIFYRVQKPGFWMIMWWKFLYPAQQFFTFRG